MTRPVLTLIICFFLLSCEKSPPGMVLIPRGEFVLGIQPDKKIIQFMTDATLARNAQPAQRMHLESYFIDRYEVTYEEFHRFKSTFEYEVKDPREPIRGVSWHEADAYCLWREKRLPTEMEWEKAARGADERLFVWGSDFNREYANFGKQVRPVGTTPKDTSAYGLHDMNGNVSEWTASWYQPYTHSRYEDKLFGKKVKVLRGGSIQKREHGFMKEFTMVPYRNFAPPTERFWDTGFRCAKSA